MTLLFHVDESRDRRYHLHVGLLATGAAVAEVTKELDALVWDAFDSGACTWEAEIHGEPLFHRKEHWSRATPDQTIAIFEGTLRLLAAHEIEVIVRGANLAGFQGRYGTASDPYRWEFSNLLERCNERLRSRREYGLVIADQQHEYRELLQRDLADAHKHGTGGYRSSRLERIVDTAHFVDLSTPPEN